MNTYSSKKSALRAAKKQNLEQFEIQELDSKFVIVLPEPANENVEQVIEQEIDGAAVELTIPVELTTPFAFCWAFFSSNAHLSRKAQIDACVAYGFNANTVKTQRSRFESVGGDKQLWLAREKSKRDAEKARVDAIVAEIQAAKQAELLADAVDVSDVAVVSE